MKTCTIVQLPADYWRPLFDPIRAAYFEETEHLLFFSILFIYCSDIKKKIWLKNKEKGVWLDTGSGLSWYIYSPRGKWHWATVSVGSSCFHFKTCFVLIPGTLLTWRRSPAVEWRARGRGRDLGSEWSSKSLRRGNDCSAWKATRPPPGRSS